jgi:hypothetical protein
MDVPLSADCFVVERQPGHAAGDRLPFLVAGIIAEGVAI